jgi:PPM family protein phosphatase
MAELRWGAATHEGQLRSQNEDHLHAGDGLFVVADGMGGHLAGEVASEMAVARLRENLLADDGATLDRVVASIDEANAEIYTGSLENADQAGMGTTVTTVAVVADVHDGEVFAIANVGDSRGYVLRHARLRQLTIDHSFVQELVAEGAISRDEARVHPRRNIVTRALGIEPTVRIDSWTMPIFQGDRLLLCSDGLVDEVADGDIAEILLTHGDDPQAAADALVEAANEAGGRDNISVVVIDVLDGDNPPDPTEEFDVVPLWADDGLESTGETQIVADPLPDEPDDTSSANAAVGDGTDGDVIDVDVATSDDSAVDDATVAISDVPPSGDAPTLPEPGPTASAPPVAAPPTTKRRRSRSAGLIRFLLVVGVAAVIVLGAAILAAWARSGYFVAFDEDGRVAIYQGREDGFLWFDPTIEAYGQYDRDQLSDDSIALVDDHVHFESQDSAARFVAERLKPATADTTQDGA